MKENYQQVYIGETKRMLRTRVADHQGYVSTRRTDKATGAHFNMSGHSPNPPTGQPPDAPTPYPPWQKKLYSHLGIIIHLSFFR